MRSSQGKGRARRKGLLAALLASAAAFAALAAPAHAEYEELDPIGSGATLGTPSAVALDETNNYLYSANAAFAGGGVVKMDLAGNQIGSALNPGANYGVGVDQTSGMLYAIVAPPLAAPEVSRFDSAGTPVGSTWPATDIGFGSFAAFRSAVGPTGDLFMPNITPPTEEEGEVIGLPVGIFRYAPSGSEPSVMTGSGANTLARPTSVDVDSAGNTYVVDGAVPGLVWTGGKVVVYDANGEFVDEVAAANADDLIMSVAVNRANGDVFIVEGIEMVDGEGNEGPGTVQISAYELLGGEYVKYDTLGAGAFATTAGFLTWPKATVDSRDGTVYVADPGNQVVRVFFEPQPPTVATGSASGVTQVKATLNGGVNPNGFETECVFIYGEEGDELDQEAPCGFSPGEGKETIDVSANVTGLSANTEYEFALIAENEVGETEGEIESFTTLPNAPVATTGSAGGVSQSAATLNATVNANGGSASCVFQYGTSAAYGSTVPCSVNPVAGATATAVSAALSGLSAATTYHFRVVTENAGGKANGVDQTFTTAAHTCETDASLCPPPEKPADPGPAPAPAPAPAPPAKPKPLKCKKGFQKKKVKGKQKCVKVKAKKKGKGKKKKK